MGWMEAVILLHALQYVSLSESLLSMAHPADMLEMPSETFQDNNLDLIPTDSKLEVLDRLLTELLIRPWPKDSSPLVYVEKPSQSSETEFDNVDNLDYPEYRPSQLKRSRVYRRYPWKRQNRFPYDAENRYMCEPSKEDVFRLLIALHEARQGSRGHTVNFCNRKRPAHAVFTNIRFLGRRK